MASTQATTDGDRIETEVYHDGGEVAVRARSQHSRSAHIPTTDDDGDVVFTDSDGNRVDETHDDANPKPKCGCTPNTDTEWVLRPTRAVANRDKCSRCFDSDAVAEQNKKNGGSATFARKLRFGESWGDEDSSANPSHTSGD